MVDNIQEKVSHLEQRITKMEAAVRSTAGDESVHPVASVAQNQTCFVGRICCDTGESAMQTCTVACLGSDNHSSNI
jgi:hypothetical protein